MINGFGPGAGEQFAALTAGGGISGSFATINLPSIDGRPAFTVQTIAGPPQSVELFAAVVAPDLAAVGGSITVNGVSPASAAGTTGQSLTVGYTIANLSSDAATGTWTDSVYLSANGLLDADSLLLGRVSHAGGLAGMSSYKGTLTGVVPGAVDGAYSVIVVADSGMQVPDLDRTNNAGVSTGAVPVRHPDAGARRHRERDDRGRAGPLLQSDGAAGPGCRDRRLRSPPRMRPPSSPAGSPCRRPRLLMKAVAIRRPCSRRFCCRVRKGVRTTS